MAEYGRRRSPAKRVSWETGIEGSNPSLSARIFVKQKFWRDLVKKDFDGSAYFDEDKKIGEISPSAEGGEAEPPTRIFP
jgi:hypothetical protein